jgi:ribonuclease Y
LTIGLWVIILFVAVSFFIFAWIINSYYGKNSLKTAKKKAQVIITNAKVECENLKKEKLLEANEEIYNQKQNLEEEYRHKFQELNKQESELNETDANINRKADLIAKKEKELSIIDKELKTREQQIQLKNEKLTNLINEHNKMLEKIAGITPDEAKTILMNNLIEDAKKGAAKTIHSITEEAKTEGFKKAQNIIISAIQQSGIDMAVESTVSIVNLPNDDMKGRIIGREGRNIRVFEITTGIDIIVDDTPGSVILSSFDPLRREIARIVMERLVADGRIHPGRIEDMYEKVKAEMNDYMRELGEQALLECGIHGVHPDLVQLLGKLKYRTSFGQNVLQHSKEVAIISGIMASELGLSADLAKRSGILHDIGRAVERTTDSNHSQVGYELAKKYNENPIVLNAIAAHHGNTEFISPISILVQVANEISISRPGARREAIENFIKRLKQIEAIAESFDGVKYSYAIQAGKEVRVIVAHEKVEDPMITLLAKDIAQKIEDEIEYPGQIKVTVIREFRKYDYA